MNDINTFNDLYQYYKLLKFPTYSKSTIISYENIYQNYLSPLFGSQFLENLTFEHYQQFLNNLITSGLSPKTISNIRALLLTVYSFAMKIDRVAKNPIKLTTIQKFDNKRYYNEPEETQIKFIESVLNNDLEFKNKDFKDILLFLLHGRRKSEVLQMKWGYLNLFTGYHGFYTVPAHINKTKTNQVYTMTKNLNQMFMERYNKLDRSRSIDNLYVFINPQTNDRYKCIRRSFKKFLKENDLPDMRLHDIRHLVATFCINYLKEPLAHVQQALGHKCPTTTQKYVTLNPSLSKNVTNSMIKSVSR